MRSGFLALDALRHRVAIAGRVTDAATQQPLVGAQVVLSAVPPAFAARLSVLAGLAGTATLARGESRPDRTYTAADGAYRFTDLPPGSYTLTVTAGPQYQPASTTASVTTNGGGEIQMTLANIAAARTS